jgi:mannosyltransferase OCH1-like enzyme
MVIPSEFHRTVSKETTQSAMCKDSLFKFHPGCEYREWSLSQLYTLIADNYPTVLHVFKYVDTSAKMQIGRYCIAHRFGGVVLDEYVEFRASIDTIFKVEPLAELWLPYAFDWLPVGLNTNRRYTNFILASLRNNNFWEHVLEQVRVRHESVHTRITTNRAVGEEVLGFVRKHHKQDVQTFPRTDVLTMHCPRVIHTKPVVVYYAEASRSINQGLLVGLAKHDCNLRELVGVHHTECSFPYVFISVYAFLFLCAGFMASRLTKTKHTKQKARERETKYSGE